VPASCSNLLNTKLVKTNILIGEEDEDEGGENQDEENQGDMLDGIQKEGYEEGERNGGDGVSMEGGGLLRLPDPDDDAAVSTRRHRRSSDDSAPGSNRRNSKESEMVLLNASENGDYMMAAKVDGGELSGRDDAAAHHSHRSTGRDDAASHHSHHSARKEGEQVDASDRQVAVVEEDQSLL
jgi:hypothetical protein